MNAAARLLNQGALSRGWAISFLWSRMEISTIGLVIAILVSAISTVYVTNMTRGLNAGLQQSFADRDHLRVQWEQLLLEKSTWMEQARVQHIAEKRLEMVVPDSQSVVIVE